MEVYKRVSEITSVVYSWTLQICKILKLLIDCNFNNNNNKTKTQKQKLYTYGDMVQRRQKKIYFNSYISADVRPFSSFSSSYTKIDLTANSDTKFSKHFSVVVKLASDTLCSPKDKIPIFKWSEIYEVNCSGFDNRFKERLAHAIFGKVDKSFVV